MPRKRLVALLILAVVLYGGFKASPLVLGPSLSLSSPVALGVYPGGSVPVTGVARHTEKLTLNGLPLLIDEQGRFATVLDLPAGGAILSMTVTDRFGRTHATSREVYVP